MTTKLKDVFMIMDRKDDEKFKTPWPRIGVAFVNKDDSLNVILDAVPMTGKIHIRDCKFKQKEKGQVV